MIFLDILRLAEGVHARRLRLAVALKVGETLCAAVPFVVLWGMLELILRLDRPPFEACLPWLGLGLAGLLGQYLFGLFAARLAFTHGYGLMADFRVRFAEHLARLPSGFFTEARIGELTSLVSDSVRMIEDVFTHLVGELVAAAVLPLVVGVLLLWIDWRMGLAALVTVPLAWAVPVLVGRAFNRLVGQRLRSQEEIAARLLEYIDGMPVIRAHGMGGGHFKALEAAMRDFRRAALRLEATGGLAVIGFAVALELGFVALLGLGTYLLLGGGIAGAAFLTVVVLAQKFYAPMTQTAMLVAEAAFLSRAYQRVRAVIDLPTMPEPALPKSPPGHHLTFERVDFAYRPGRPVLHGLSATIPAGQVTALVGSSGAGKSTVVQLAARLFDPDRGSVRMGGVDLREIGSEGVRARVAMVLQEVHLLDDTVAENIRLGRPEASDAEVRRAARAAQCEAFIEALPAGYETPVGEAGARLSGGEKQRLSIARALLKDAPILIMDESTAAIDAETELAFQRAFETLRQGRTVLLIAHRLSSVVRADQILVMSGGRICERGTHAELVAREGPYQRLWQASRF
ncbi:ABC transporter ATP-binding protein [Roseospirillum parvum]|uniref:ATP-binding cassette, subfamily B n=1 Tax=Roseospirillum parvum TaxID=83401 RepID=A0A1G8C4P2_9PROT|nr:ABC transporter ATP-binding protein [Roseospirillum parvum]SDH40382.1 ATP-binding cassette, subfamily B [Roseospirillum parvum]